MKVNYSSCFLKYLSYRFCIIVFTIFNLSANSYSQSADAVITLSIEKLRESKNLIFNGDKQLVLAKSVILKEANKIILANKNYSIVFKEQKAPSGKPNDYYSLAPYWWPDKKSKTGLPYIRIDGKKNPENDKIGDFRKLESVSHDVLILGLAYYLSGEDRYAERVQNIINVFFTNPKTKMNANLNYAQVVKGRKLGSGGSASISSIGFVKLIDGIQLIHDSKYYNSEVIRQSKVWFGEFLKWLESDERVKKEASSDVNISTYYTLQVACYKSFIGNRENLKSYLTARWLKHINDQLDDNGVMKEEIKRNMSFNYTLYNTEAFLDILQLGRNIGLDLLHVESEGKSFEKTFNWLTMTIKSGNWKYSKENINYKNNTVRTILKSYGSFESLGNNISLEDAVFILTR